MSRTLHLALHPYGVGGPGQHGLWKDPRVAKNASIDIGYYIRQAQAAEHALFDALFIVDSQFINATYPAHYLNRLEPLTLLSAVATHTRHVGLVGTASSTYNSPFNLARRFASLDHISGGRAGWNVVTSFDTGTSRNFGLEEHLDYTTRYRRALEFVQVARGLWDSYEDDAFPADVERNLFLDPSRLHRLDHEGEHFKVAGPLNISRSPQGQPVIFQAGVSEEGRDLAARVAEGIYAPGGPLEQAREYYADIKRRTVAYGRDPEHIKIFIHGGPVVATTDEAARRREREIFEEDHDFDRNLALLGRSFGAYDFSVHDLDAPFPDVAHLAEKGGRTGAAKLIARAKAENLTLRQVAESLSEFRRSPFVGAPETVADTIGQWFAAGAFDGINLAFRTDEDLELFVDGVVPILQKRGLYRTEYPADTLRGNLGLPVPVNRWTRERSSANG
ncbi:MULTISPECIES: LLM class flavin-dependent oxidoreductase [Streptomyces]|uniref:FMN-dependent oxidoreductase (Nitrilotriacetate monooxygenase family) n=2 Tax=Streptomyces TaxID=1883 RepID=A0ABT9L8W2_9ACTN|nr:MULTISPECIES: LLM class flavin-dependent oxidoreductase [Streptomyces]MBW8091028.1 LLM class flavin-dependent oxidoreductase [Streptomyces hygroscopicus subsp. hygroscopicus]MDN3059479.1 LLM class flavin-dependent oxidoreductase [Streptomyces sp. SRF1]MDP9615966.1 FMN-dependent oxidoreductase (nitrilotriacetate monooxygenase family) [Streptomyces demainii]